MLLRGRVTPRGLLLLRWLLPRCLLLWWGWLSLSPWRLLLWLVRPWGLRLLLRGLSPRSLAWLGWWAWLHALRLLVLPGGLLWLTPRWHALVRWCLLLIALLPGLGPRRL